MEAGLRMITIQVELDSRMFNGSALLIPFSDDMLVSATRQQRLHGVLADHLQHSDLLATMEKVSM